MTECDSPARRGCVVPGDEGEPNPEKSGGRCGAVGGVNRKKNSTPKEAQKMAASRECVCSDERS